MQNWQLAAEALLSGLMMSHISGFPHELNWLREGSKDMLDRPPYNSGQSADQSILAVAIQAVNKEEGTVVFMHEQFLIQVWNCSGPLRNRVAKLDDFIERYILEDDSARFLFDVCYTHWLSTESVKGDLSDAWLSDEEMLADRGSELLTVLMYIQEVNASGLEADLNDFVDAFLTDEDFDMQDDLGVFEVLIQQAPGLELPYAQLIQDSFKASIGTPLEALLPGLMCFFKDAGEPIHGIGPVFSARSVDKHLLPVYMCLMTALKSEWCFPEHLRPNSLQRTFFGSEQAS